MKIWGLGCCRSRLTNAGACVSVLGFIVGCGTTQQSGERPSERAFDQQSALERDDACRLLEDRDARMVMSGALEIKLNQLCSGTTPTPRATGATARAPESRAAAEALGGNDILVNDPSIDTGGSTQSETSVVAFGNVVCAAWNDAGQGFGTNGFSGFGVSSNGGMSFTDRGAFSKGPAGQTDRGDPSLAYSVRDAAFYYAAIGTTGLGLWRSNDSCQTFSYVGPISTGSGDDKELIAIDNTPSSPFYGRIHVGWTDFNRSSDRNVASFSDNGGGSWSPQAPMPGSGTAGQGMFPAVAPNGDVYFALLDRSGSTRTEWIYKSTNGGSSFLKATDIAANLTPPRDATATSTCGRDALKGEIRNLPSPQIAISPDAGAPAGYVVHAVYPYDSDGAGPDTSNVFYRRSLDGALTWSAELQLNDDATTADQFFPSLGLSPGGVLGVSWYDRRLDPNNLSFDRYFVQSSDGGLSWGPNERLSDVSSPVAETQPNFDGLAACYHGDYDLIAGTNEAFHVVWSDDRRVTASGPNPDVYYDKVPLNLALGRLSASPSIGGCSSTVALVLTDADLAGAGTQTIGVTTTTGDSESLALTEGSTLGSFTGNIAFASGTATPGDGVLQVANAATATFRYDDANDGTGNPAVATASVVTDCAGPVLGNIAPSGVSGTSASIGMTSNEPATVTLAYGLACASTTATAASTVPSLTPQVTLGSLNKNTKYFFKLTATDLLGNVSTYDNDGSCYELTTPNSILTETFEGGLGSFVVESGLWHRTVGCASLLPGHSTPSSLYFGQDGTCNFDTGARTLGTVRSQTITLSASEVGQAALSFNYLTQGESGVTFDRAWLELVVNGAAPIVVASNYGTGVALTRNTGAWGSAVVDLKPLLPPGVSSTLQLAFGFDSVDSIANTGAGFLVDDIEILASSKTCTVNAECTNGTVCDGNETCSSGVCVSGTPLNCNDGTACTNDSCDPVAGCVNLSLDCNDQNACTADTCSAATGCVSTAIDCSDTNACTVNFCDPTTGCGSTPLFCSDANACTVDFCDPATGCGSTPLACSDGNVCTNDSCDPATGCVFTNNTSACADDGNPCTSDVCNAGACSHPDNGTCSSGPFQESGGQVVIEGEHFHANVARGSDAWSIVNNGSASGGQVMQCGPDNGTNVNTGYVSSSPELRFQVQFVTTGTYQVWLRGIGVNVDGDSCHAGIDGTGPASADRISTFGTALGWSRSTMDNANATINVTTPGLHTISIWMREDGFVLDKLLLTTNSGFTPTAAGPAESPRAQGCTSAAQCNDQNPCTQDSCSSGVCQHSPAGNGTACADDGNACTNDVCSAGTCTHPNNTATCADDGNSCTSDVCNAGVCTHPANGSCQGQQPCASFCTNPTVFVGPNYNSGNLGTQATCHETTTSLSGGVCGNLASSRQLKVNGQVMSCNGGNWSALPAKVNGGYCIQTTTGDFPWAYFATW